MTATGRFIAGAKRYPSRNVSQNRAADGPWAVVRFEGGPLDGLRLSVLQREALSPSMGFCTVTDTGPVQVLYRDGGDGRRVFESVARVG